MKKNSATGLISILLGAVYLFMTVRLPEVGVGDPTGPRLFPLLVGLLAVVCGLILNLAGMFSGKSNRQDRLCLNWSAGKSRFIQIGVIIAAGLIYGFLLDPLGYLISTFLFMIMIMFLFNQIPRFFQNVIISLGFSVTTYVFFAILLKLSLPRGILSF